MEENKTNWIRCHPVWTALGLLCFALISLYIVDTKPWKIKNPSDSRFVKEQFVFEDYSNKYEFEQAASLLFKNMPVAKAEIILMNFNQAIKSQDRSDSRRFSYCRKRKDWFLKELLSFHPSYPWCVILYTDEAQKEVISVSVKAL